MENAKRIENLGETQSSINSNIDKEIEFIMQAPFQQYFTISKLNDQLNDMINKSNKDIIEIWVTLEQIKKYLNTKEVKTYMELLIQSQGSMTLDPNLIHIFYGNYDQVTKNGIVGKSVETILRLQ